MSTTIGSLTYNVKTDVSGFEKGLKKIRTELRNAAKEASAFAAEFSKKFTLPIAALGAASAAAYAKQEAAQTRLAAELKASGEYSRATLEHYQSIASGLQQLTVVGDESTLALMQIGVQMGVGARQMESFSKASIGVSRALGVDLNAAGRLVAQGLQGQYASLSRYIPALKQARTEQEKAALAAEYFARAYGTALGETSTLSGAVLQAKNALGDAAEQIGKVIAPAIIKLANGIKAASEWFSELNDVNKKLVVGLGTAVAILPPLVGAFAALAKAIAIAKLAANSFSIALTKTGVGALVVGLGLAAGAIYEFVNADDEETESLEESAREAEELSKQLKEVSVANANAAQNAEDAKNAFAEESKAAEALNKEMDKLNGALFSADDELRKVVSGGKDLSLTFAQNSAYLKNQIERLKSIIVEGKTRLAQLRDEGATTEQIAAQTRALVADEKELSDLMKRSQALKQGKEELDIEARIADLKHAGDIAAARALEIERDALRLAKEKGLSLDEARKYAERLAEAVRDENAERAKNQAEARKTFELEQSIAWYRKNGYQAEADAIELQKKANELVEKYGYSWERALKIAREMNAELNKHNGAGYSDRAIQKARDFVAKAASGKLNASEAALADAQAILSGDTSHELKSNQFKAAKSKRASADTQATAAALIATPTSGLAGAPAASAANTSAAAMPTAQSAGASRESSAMETLAETVRTLVGRLDALFPITA